MSSPYVHRQYLDAPSENLKRFLYFVSIIQISCLLSLTVLDRACWEQNVDVADESILVQLLNDGGYDGPDLMRRARQADVKTRLRELTAQAKEYGICGVPSYRILTQAKTAEWEPVGGIIWGQDELNVVEDVIAGWTDEDFESLAEVRVATTASQEKLARL
jgi:2-hydroxychromene-2-carboxylate isomerase